MLDPCMEGFNLISRKVTPINYIAAVPVLKLFPESMTLQVKARN